MGGSQCKQNFGVEGPRKTVTDKPEEVWGY